MQDERHSSTVGMSNFGARGLLLAAGLFLQISAVSAVMAQSQPDVPAQNPPTGPAVTVAPESTPSSGAAVATAPVAIVSLDQSVRGAALSVSGSMQVRNGRALINGSGSVTAGTKTANVTLPYRGTLRVCTSTTVNLAADRNAPPGGLPGLLMAMDHGAVEMSFATTPSDANADTLMTPDFRILVSGPGASEVKVRLGNQGDTCVDNGAPDKDAPAATVKPDAPYVVVSSLFDAETYRVQPGQRVMFQHGSLREVIDQEKEPCGCPPAEENDGNEFPLAQSEGLAPMPQVTPPASQVAAPAETKNNAPPLVYPHPEQQASPAASATQPAPATPPSPAAATPAAPPTKQARKKPGVFTKIGHFFKRVFGAES